VKVTGYQTLRMTQLQAISNPVDWFEWGQGWVADFVLRPPTLTASNFYALKSTDFIFTVLKDLTLLRKYIKNQKGSYNFRQGFAFSNRPHFHSALY